MKLERDHGSLFFVRGKQVVWMLGRPTQVTAFFIQDGAEVPGFADNTLGVLAYKRALAFVDIAAMVPAARGVGATFHEGSRFSSGLTARNVRLSASAGRKDA